MFANTKARGTVQVKYTNLNCTAHSIFTYVYTHVIIIQNVLLNHSLLAMKAVLATYLTWREGKENIKENVWKHME